jgi:molybdate transport system ATP-binding protein
MNELIVEVEGATVIRDGRTIFSNLDWSLREGETWAIVGPTGSGKTTFAEMLLGRHQVRGGGVHWPLLDRLRQAGRRVDYPSQVIAHVSFKEESRLFSYVGHYYQQRFEFADSDEPLSLNQFLRTSKATSDELLTVAEQLGIAGQLTQPFMTLSNGQTRRARLARALITKPELLILDDPFIGLDARGRSDLSELLAELVRGERRVMLICREDATPSWVTNVLHCGTGKSWRTGGVSPLKGTISGLAPHVQQAISLLPTKGDAQVELNSVSVIHAGRAILDKVSWTVRAGERWAVVGPNGSGKTTLLSLLCGDHPQAYSNDVRLFGRQRGTGETIWDVKRNVGLVSPEFHLYFTEPLTAERTVAAGFFDVVADRPTTLEQTARVRELFAAFGITHLLDRQFRCLSTGEQRLVLLLRALVKRPPLLILDEPFQGFDSALVERSRAWLDRELGDDQTLLFVSHDLQELPECVDRMVRLEAGRVR